MTVEIVYSTIPFCDYMASKNGEDRNEVWLYSGPWFNGINMATQADSWCLLNASESPFHQCDGQGEIMQLKASEFLGDRMTSVTMQQITEDDAMLLRAAWGNSSFVPAGQKPEIQIPFLQALAIYTRYRNVSQWSTSDENSSAASWQAFVPHVRHNLA